MNITSKLVTVTPGMASAWLEDNKFDNRNLSDRNVNRIMRDIKAGKWVFDGNPIRFDSGNNILDGQHRLWAIVMAAKPVDCLIVRGLQNEAKMTIDTGKMRNNADILHFKGHTNTSALAALARLSIAWHKNKGNLWKWSQDNSHARLSTQEIVAEVEKNKVLTEILQCAMRLRFTKKILGPGTASFCYYILLKHSQDSVAVESFFSAFETGTNLDINSPVLLLRNIFSLRDHAIVDRNQGGNKAVAYKVALLIKVWNAYRDKKEIKKLRFDPDKESFPIPH